MRETWKKGVGKCVVGIGSCVGVSGLWESMGEMWKSVWGDCGGCVEVGKSVLGCVEMWGSQHTLLHLSPHPPHSPNTTPLHPHTHLSRLSTLSHTHLPHSLTLPHTLTPFLYLPQHFPTLTPHTFSLSPRLLQHFRKLPILYHSPHAKISHFAHLLPN